jgi:hypothetical protein
MAREIAKLGGHMAKAEMYDADAEDRDKAMER